MGCVLGTRAAGERGDRRNKKNHQVEKSNSESVAVAVRNGEEVKIEEAAAPVPEFRRPEFRVRRGVSAGGGEWPSWLIDIAGQAIKDWEPRRANSFEKLLKIGQGTYSNVYKARDLISGKIVALKKVRFNNLEPEAVRFMAREILVLRRLNHPNVIKLEGVAISRISSSLYLVFEYMEHDLAGLAAAQTAKFTLAQVKCYMRQLLSGLEHCHSNGVLHRDIKCSNLLINNEGILRIADFGLASFFDPECRRAMTSRVVTLWYRPPELLLGSTHYGVGVDLWSSGCILAELFAGKPILRGRTEVEQVHKIFKLCGSPSEEYWKKSRLPNVSLYKPQQPYNRCIAEAFKDFPPSSLPLLETLLAIYPDARGTATSALDGEFFTTEPYACEPSSLPKFPPSKEMDIKLRDEAARRQRASGGKPHVVDGNGRARARNKLSRAVPVPEANPELRSNLDRLTDAARRRSKTGKFPPPHEDAGVGHPLNAPRNGAVSFGGDDTSFTSSIFDGRSSQSLRSTSPKSVGSRKEEPRRARLVNGLDPSYIGWGLGFRRRRTVSENFRDRR